MKKILIFLSLGFIGCSPEKKEISAVDFGEVSDTQKITSFLVKDRKLQVKTDKGFVTVYGDCYLGNGTKTELVEYSNGQKFLRLKDTSVILEVIK